MRKPPEVWIALGMLWLGLAFAGIEALTAALNRFGILPLASNFGPASVMAEMAAFLGLLFHALCIVSVARGQGMVRYILLIGAGWIASRLPLGELVRASESVAPYHRIEPLGLALRAAAVALLFLPRSNYWFRNMRKQRHEMMTLGNL